jgi:hypothetical protein
VPPAAAITQIVEESMGHPSRAALAAVAVALVLSGAVRAQKLSPSDTVRSFYSLLREQKYADGFALSVYADAVDGLSDEEISELAPDFQATAASIPADIRIAGEKISGDTATVMADFGTGVAQPVELVKQRGRWLVGDRESLKVVQREKTAFFFNTRIEVNQNAAYGVMRTILEAEESYLQQTKTVGTIEDLVKARLLPEALRNGTAGGYRYAVQAGTGQRPYFVTGVPERYSRTGKLSFYADAAGVRAADNRGNSVDTGAPLMKEQIVRP